MNPEVKQKWVAALRSGEYPQTQECLRYVNEAGVASYCCLGVLTDLYIKEHPDAQWESGIYNSATCFVVGEGDDKQLEELVLPAPVRVWAGLASDNPDVTYTYEDEDTGEPIKSKNCLAELNDNLDKKFPELADAIEQSL